MQTWEWLDRHRAERSAVGSEYGRRYAEQSDRSAFFCENDARNLPNEANVNLYGMCGLMTSTRNLPNEAKVNLYGMCGLMTDRGNRPNEATSQTAISGRPWPIVNRKSHPDLRVQHPMRFLRNEAIFKATRQQT